MSCVNAWVPTPCDYKLAGVYDLIVLYICFIVIHQEYTPKMYKTDFDYTVANHFARTCALTSMNFVVREVRAQPVLLEWLAPRSRNLDDAKDMNLRRKDSKMLISRATIM